MKEIFDTYCIEAADLDAARTRVEQATSLQFVRHESMYWGGDYYLGTSSELGRIAIRPNYNSHTRELNEPEHPDCQVVVSVSEALQPDALKAMLGAHGIRLVKRSVLENGKLVMSDSMRYLIPVGFYRELRGGKPHEPSLRDVIQPTADPKQANVLQYLHAGEVLVATGGVVSDVLDPTFGIIGPPHILTDGKYAWPAILAHYVERYHIRLPEDFMSHMMSNNWHAPREINMDMLRVKH